MITIAQRPQGARVSSTVNITYVLVDDGYGSAILTTGSGLSHGDTILIYESYTSYNGFWYLEEFQTGKFYIREYEDGPKLTFVRQDSPNILRSLADVDWSCVHLPILYRLTSDKYPVNSTADPSRSVTQIENDNGFIKLTLSGSFETFVALDWLYITNSSEEDLNTSWQILTKHSSSQLTIDAPYELTGGSQYVLNSATVKKWYENYKVNVRVYGGLNASHRWVDLKPYELIDTLEPVPNDDNEIKINVSGILKEKISITENRPNYDSESYDLDRFCQFYIEVAESYDQSDGVTVTTFTDDYTSDQGSFEGWAHDAVLEFKNRYSGYLSEWVYADASNLAKFLTLADRPVMFNGWYFDLGFINSFGVDDLYLIQDCYNESDVLTGTLATLFTGQTNEGICRFPLLSSSEFYQKVYLAPAEYLLQTSLWTQSGTAFATPTAARFSLTSAGAVVLQATQPLILKSGQTIPTMAWNWSNNGTARTGTYTILVDGSVILISGAIGGTGSTAITIPASLLAADITFLEILININAGVSTLLSLDIATVGQVLGFDYVDLYSEQLTIDVSQRCPPFEYYLTWKNAQGGFDYFLFTAFKDHNINIEGAQSKDKNIFPTWPKSYGENASGIKKETVRKSRRSIRIRSQNLTQGQVDYIAGIKTSSLVQVMESKYNLTDVIVDTDSFKKYMDSDKLFSIEFNIVFTDNIPSQSL